VTKRVASQQSVASDIGYAEAVAELDVILATLEASDVDVDQLATQVRRAAELITFCRERITGARLQIDNVIAELEASAPEFDDELDGGGDVFDLDEDADD